VLARRADLERARLAVTAAEADVRLQRANGVPDPDLMGGYKRNSATNTGYASLQIPLPFRNRNQGEIQRAEASVRYAQTSLQALELQLRAEIAQSEENYRREQDIVTNLLPDMRAKASQNLQLMTEAYRIGGADLLRYLDAERTEFDVEVSALRTYAEYQQAALRLQLSYGVQP
jgi:cobalt-zinc-cadmium efflux system outer membrane protein